MVYAYIRVSTETQTLENQKIVIRQYCRRKKITGIRWIAETISGIKEPTKRKLGDLLAVVEEGDVVILTELSRLGRSLIMIFNVLQEFLDKKVLVIAIKENYELGDNVQSKVLAFAFGLSAEIERQLISERTKAGLLRARKAGKKIGRAPGECPHKIKLTGKEDFIRRKLKRGRSVLSLAKELGVAWATMNKFIKKFNLRN